MALYGSVDAVKQMLRADVASVFNADAEARLAALQLAVSAFIEHETGRVFGGTAMGEAIGVWARGVSHLLLLPKAVREVSSVVLSPVLTATGFAGGTTLDRPHWGATFVTATGEASALIRFDGVPWPELTVVTGTWEDARGGTVPPDITNIANLIIAEAYKREQASPNGAIGPDGSVIPLRNWLRDPLVDRTLAYWRAAAQVVI